MEGIRKARLGPFSERAALTLELEAIKNASIGKLYERSAGF